MKHLNYFQPYDKGNESHEDHLTRAFISLLRLSSSTLQNFYGYVCQQFAVFEDSPLRIQYEMNFQEMNFQTQVGSLPIAIQYVSILITNEPINITIKIEPTQRGAIYDGVVQFEEKLVFIIETKPINGNVWVEQLCPSQKDIPEEASLYDKPAILEWKTIINFMHHINNNPYTTLTEKILITDFFAFINENFDYLNPYNEFSKCHSSTLAIRRIETILTEIAFDEEKVAKHQGWGYFIQLDFPEIRKIALLLNKSEEDWTGLTIAVDFGSTVSQARSLYTNLSSYSVFEEFTDWTTYCNLHLAFQNTNLIFISSPAGVNERYFDYWKRDVWTNFGGKLKADLQDDLLEYAAEGIIDYNNEKRQEIDATTIRKGYQRINICPALYQEYCISKADAIELDASGKLAPFIKGKNE